MLRVVVSNNPEVLARLDSPRLQRLGLEVMVAEHYSALEELVRTKHPELVVLDAELRGGSGFQLSQALRANPNLRDLRVVLVLGSILERTDLDAINASGCDDVLTLPFSDDDLFHHIVTLAGRTFRKNERVAVELEVELEIDEEKVPATVVDMSAGGLGLRLDDPLTEGLTVTAILHHDGVRYPPARAVVAWTRLAGGDHLAGLSFAEVPVDTRLLIEALTLFEVFDVPAGGVRAYIHGDIIETTRLEPLAARLADADFIELNLREVRYLSSAGVRRWCHLLESLAGKRYSFRHASLGFVSQMSLAPVVRGTAEVLSFEAPYHCEHCERDDVRLLDTAALYRRGDEIVPPTLRCPSCGGELLFDELPWRYFAFLQPDQD
ncbi:MAG TPA: PilZ domain-containing protein [Kofleriaceae bacterium]|nr:PilZ domain-containing protein [Kofleriaceae bacterium]